MIAYLLEIVEMRTHLQRRFSSTSATRQVRQREFSVGIFPLRQLFGLIGNRPQSAPACSFLRYKQLLAASEQATVRWTMK